MEPEKEREEILIASRAEFIVSDAVSGRFIYLLLRDQQQQKKFSRVSRRAVDLRDHETFAFLIALV